MDNKERAEKIVDDFPRLQNQFNEPIPENYAKAITLLAAQLDEAQREAIEVDRDRPELDRLADCVRYKQRVYSEGFAAAQEKATGIAYDYDHDCAERIRAMTMEDK